MRFAISALAVAALAGCGGGPYQQQEREVRAETARYFADLNAEAETRAIDAKAVALEADLPASGLTLSRFDWDLNGSVFPNVVCPQCKAQLGWLATTGVDLKCPECATGLMEELARIGRAIPMFEIKSGQTLPIVVVVRYVRRMYVYDPNATVAVSAKAQANFPIDTYTAREPHNPRLYYAGGFYRLAGEALGMTGFVYRGGSLHQIDPDSIKKMTADPPETVPVSAMKIGPSAPVEIPLKPWLGKRPEGVTPKAPEKPQ